MVSIDRFLIIDDCDAFRSFMRAFITKFYPESILEEYEMKINGDITDDFDWSRYDVLFLDYDLGEYGNGLNWYKQHKRNSNFPATIMLTGSGNEQIAVKAIKTGIHEYLPKEALSKKNLSQSINNAIETKAEEIEKELSMTQVGTTFNKSIFFGRLENANTIKEEENTVLVLILLDAHEVIGQTWGLLARDNIIRHITKKTNQYLRTLYPDLNITRYGDQYVAVLFGEPKTSQELKANLSNLCKQFQNAVYKEGNSSINFTVSVAAVPLKGIDMNANEIISLALDICHEEKKTTGNSFIIYNPERNETENSIVKDFSSEKFDVISAIEEDRIIPVFQQLVSLTDDFERPENETYEVRTRFLKMNGNLLEDYGLKEVLKDKTELQLIDKWIVRTVVGKLLRLENSSEANYKCAIKLSGYSLSSSEFMFWVMELLKKNKLKNMSLLIEVDVNDFLKHAKPISGLMAYLRNIYNYSFILSPINDPETLKLVFNQEKFDYIKLDSSLTKGLNIKGEFSEKIDAIIDLAKKLDVKVIASCIEDTNSLYAAHDKKIDLVQGNFISPPQEDIEYMSELI